MKGDVGKVTHSGVKRTVGVLFVCLGNICRSPMAQGVFEQRVRRAGLDDYVRVDSAGTHAYHVGKGPDPRAREAAARRDIDIGGQRGRVIEVNDFRAFDYVIGMDRANYELLRYTCPKDRRHVVHLFLDFAPELGQREVPDPYYGEEGSFERALDLIEAASDGLLAHIHEHHLSD